jgi:hypothetical protein
MANLGAVSQAVTFSTAFASTPLIFLTVVPATGSTFMDGVIASIGAGTATTTGFTIQLKNVSGSTTTGNVVVNWRAAA